MAKDVYDLAVLLDVMQGEDEDDPRSEELSFTSALRKKTNESLTAWNIERIPPTKKVPQTVPCFKCRSRAKISGLQYVHSTDNLTFKGYKIGIPRQVSRFTVYAASDSTSPSFFQQWHDVKPWLRKGRRPVDKEITEAFEAAIATMQNGGAILTDPADIPSAVDGTLWKCTDGSRSKVVCAEFKEYMGRYLRGLGGMDGCRSVDDIIA